MPSADMRFCDITYALDRGWTLESLVSAMLDLDQRCMPNVAPTLIGTVEHWAPIYRKYPETWRVGLREDVTLAAYWHFMAVTPRTRDRIVTGRLSDADMRVEHCVDTKANRGHAHMFLTSFSTDPHTDTSHCFAGMLYSLMLSIEDLARRGVFFKSLIANAVTRSSRRLCRSLAMQPLGSDGTIHELRMLPPPDFPWLRKYPEVKRMYELQSGPHVV